MFFSQYKCKNVLNTDADCSECKAWVLLEIITVFFQFEGRFRGKDIFHLKFQFQIIFTALIRKFRSTNF